MLLLASARLIFHCCQKRRPFGSESVRNVKIISAFSFKIYVYKFS